MRSNSIDNQPEKADVLLVDVAESCRRIDCSRAKFYDLVRRGEIKLVKLGRASRVRPADLERLVERLAAE
jgi:excisionase family DNA binding protein